MCQPTMTKVAVTGTVGAIFLILGCVLIPVGNDLIAYFVEEVGDLEAIKTILLEREKQRRKRGKEKWERMKTLERKIV